MITIGDGVFFSCTRLARVIIGNSVESIGEETFIFCSSLTEITVSEDNVAFSSLDGVLFNKNKEILIYEINIF